MERYTNASSFGKSGRCETVSLFSKHNGLAIKRHFYEWLIQRQIKDPSVTFKLNGLLPTDPEDHSKIISLTFDGVDAQSLVLLADAKGVCISAGSACNSHSTESSKVLRAIGLTDEEAHSTVRVSFSKFNTWDEAVRAADVIFDAAKQLKGSGYEAKEAENG